MAVILRQTAVEIMDRYKIPKEYEDCAKNIEEKTEKNLSPYLSQALLREVTENITENNPNSFSAEFMQKLKGKSYYFIKEVTREMLTEAEMYSEFKN